MPDAIAGMTAPGPLTTGNHAATESALQSLSGIGSDGFLKLLVAQLRYQSPLEPSDPGDLMLQTAQLAQLDATMQLVSLQQRDLGLQQAVLAASMVGAEITAAGPDDVPIHGLVDGVRYTSTGPVLSVGGRQVALSAVTEIRRNGAPLLPPPPPIDAPSATGPVLDGPVSAPTTPVTAPTTPVAAPTTPVTAPTNPDPIDDLSESDQGVSDDVVAVAASRGRHSADVNVTAVATDGSDDAAGVADNA